MRTIALCICVSVLTLVRGLNALAGVPLQANVAIPMPIDPGASNDYSSSLGRGGSTVSGTVRNLLESNAVQIDLLFDYRTNDEIFLDEIIVRIEISTENGSGTVGFATIDPNFINLNPNRVSLSYRATLYFPTDATSYVARVKVFGNYE